MLAAGETRDTPGHSAVYELLVSLLDLELPVERRVLVRGDCTLAELHMTIQAAMEWENYHLHMFSSARGEPLTPNDDRRQAQSERRLRLSQLLHAPGEWLGYEYDFGDRWRHRVELVQFDVPRTERSLPLCIDGRGACPPEDCGGPVGYEEMLMALADPDSAEHQERAEWLGHSPKRPFDPASFDRDAANQRLRLLRRTKR